MELTKNSQLVNKRVAANDDSTLGILYIDSEPFAFVIEDEFREKKVPGETRIPDGTYFLGLRKQLTPLTKKYLARYPWFKYHIEVLDVPNFTGIYFHVGNTEKDTAGCQIIGYQAGFQNGNYRNYNSLAAFKDFYEKIYPVLEKGYKIPYTIVTL